MCLIEVPEYSFDGRSHVHLQLAFTLPARHTQVQVLVRTRKHSSSILTLLSKEQNEYIKLEVSAIKTSLPCFFLHFLSSVTSLFFAQDLLLMLLCENISPPLSELAF